MPALRKTRPAPNRSVAVGIDLGTRNALCACVDGEGLPVMVPNRWGSTSTPSVVGWDGGWVIGEDALRLSLRGSESVWWDIKRKVGGNFSALCGTETYTAQALLVPLLSALREDAEVFVGQFVSSCILAVPACFTLLQREAMTQAANAAGLREVRIVNEPTAAALAYGREGRFLVMDFGAGTVDISVVESENGVWQVLESVGTAKVGGYDFDIALAEWLRERLLLEAFSPSDPRWRVLILEAESIKIALSTCRSYSWKPPALGGHDLAPLLVEREDLERMVRFSIRRLILVVRKLWEKHDPQRLLLVGGSSRIPLLREILEREIAHPECFSLCAEESVAAGAALYTQSGKERLLLDVLSGDVGFVIDGNPLTLLSAETPLPFTSRTVFKPLKSGKTEVSIFQNLGDLQEEKLVLSVLELNVTEGEEVVLYCALDTSGLLHLSARHENGTTVEMPLLSLKQKAQKIFADKENFPAYKQKIRELKLQLSSLELILAPEQQDRLHFLVRRIESLKPEDPQTGGQVVSALEGIVKELQLELS